MWTTANLLTSARIVLIIPFLYLIHEGRPGLALMVFFAAGITDFFDGYVARHFNQQSALGRFLDPMADKLLTTASFVVLALAHESFPSIPVWLAAAVVGRDVLILLGSLVVYLATGFTGIANRLPKEVDTSPPVRLSIPSVKIDSKVVPVTWKMIPSPGGAQKSELWLMKR